MTVFDEKKIQAKGIEMYIQYLQGVDGRDGYLLETQPNYWNKYNS